MRPDVAAFSGRRVVYEAPLRLRGQQRYAHPPADVNSLFATHDACFDRRMNQADESAAGFLSGPDKWKLAA
jgi:hypothetical protein